MLHDLLYIFGGMALLIAGAEILVRGASGLALRLGIPSIVVGLTVVALGTSAPELVVATKAALSGSGDLALGAVVGSNICNLLLILAVGALIAPIRIQRETLRIDVPIMAGCALLLCLLLGLAGELSRPIGALLTAGIITYIAFSIWRATRPTTNAETPPHNDNNDDDGSSAHNHLLLLIVLILIGLVLLKFGGEFLVDGAKSLALMMGMSEALIGLTIVAIGSSLPELATALVASAKNQGDLIVGNVIGSNIFNVLCILGIASLVAPIPFEGVTWFELGFMGLTSILVIPLLHTGHVLKRWEGLLMLAGFVLYLALVILRAT